MPNNSFDYLWQLLEPKQCFADRYNACRAFWNALSLQRQRQIYYALRLQKQQGIPFKENPLFTIQDCNPQPTNWNGKQGINNLVKTTRMVIAKYNGSYGTYTLQEAEIFQMTERKPIN